MFRYQASSPEVQHLCNADEYLAVIIKHYGTLKYTLYSNQFAFFVETIIGQMLSNKVADIITSRLVELCDGEISLNALSGLSHQRIKSIGLSNQKADYIVGFTNIIRENPRFFDELEQCHEETIMKELTKIRGIGSWTAKMYLIFSLNCMDVLPYEDGAFLQAFRLLYNTNSVSPDVVQDRCAPWKPYSSIASRYLYRALDTGLFSEPDFNREIGLLLRKI